MIKNKIAQGIIGIAIILFVVGIVWLVGLAPWISETSLLFVTANNITGFEAFFYTNTNLWIGIFYILAWVVMGRLA